MKKGLLLLLGVIAVGFLIGNSDIIVQFVTTVQGGATIPLVVAVILMFARHIVQAQSYVAAFEAVDHHPTLKREIILIFSLVFINTFCLFSGATGVAFIIDDARRDGADAGQSTSGAILSQIGYFAAVFVVCIIGFTTMVITGNINTVFLIGGLMLAGVLVGLSSLFIVGHFQPKILFWLFGILEKLINKLLGLFKKSLKEGWGKETAQSFVDNANMLANNPKGAAITVAFASLSAVLNMACLIAIGYAFGFSEVSSLMAAFALASVSVVLSPTPQGVGVVEAAIIAMLTAGGCALNEATAIALVYRGIMFWIPFCFGAVMLTQSGFFKTKKDAAEEQKDKDVAWISGILMCIVGAVNIVLVVASSLLQPYFLLTQFIDLRTIFPGTGMLLGGIVLILLGLGLIRRLRIAWAISLAVTAVLAGVDFFYVGTLLPAIVQIGLTIWLFIKRDSFTQMLPKMKKRIKKREVSPEYEEEERMIRGLANDVKMQQEAEQSAKEASAAASAEHEQEDMRDSVNDEIMHHEAELVESKDLPPYEYEDEGKLMREMANMEKMRREAEEVEVGAQASVS